MGDNGMLSSVALCNEIVVCHLEKGACRPLLVVLPCNPNTGLLQSREDGGIWRDKEAITSGAGPFVQLVVTCQQFVAGSFNAEHLTCLVLPYQPVPESWTEIKPIMQILGLDEYIGIQNVCRLSTHS